MSATAVAVPTKTKTKAAKQTVVSRATPATTFISWEKFQKEYLTREDGFKYEWLAGTVEKSPYTMERSQLYILGNIQEFFFKLKFEGKVEGKLIPEGDLFFKDHHRRPDIAWLTDEQLDSLATNKKDVPAFLIEIISKHDGVEAVAKKMNDYRKADVKVVWHIFPELKQVQVYGEKNLRKAVLYTEENEICSAAPAVPDFKMTIGEIFKKAVD